MTVIIGGGVAFLAGRGLAMKWRPMWMAVAYMVPLGLGAALPALRPVRRRACCRCTIFIVDTLVLIAGALLGYRLTRARQMVQPVPLAL